MTHPPKIETIQALAGEFDSTADKLDPHTRQGAYTIKAAILSVVMMGIGILAAFLFIQNNAESRCDEVRQQLEQQWAIVLDQLNDRLDDQSAALTRCHDTTDEHHH